jgi:hypothetical protein
LLTGFPPVFYGGAARSAMNYKGHSPFLFLIAASFQLEKLVFLFFNIIETFFPIQSGRSAAGIIVVFLVTLLP